MNIKTMSIGQAIDTYEISLTKDGAHLYILCHKTPGFDLDWVRKHKPQIIEELKSRKQKQDDEEARRQSIIDNMEGLAEIQSMQDTYARESAQRRKAIYGDGTEAPMLRTVTAEDIQKELDTYPMVRLWLEANEQSQSHSPDIAILGMDVKEDILSGMDYEQVAARRDQAAKDYKTRHQWD